MKHFVTDCVHSDGDSIQKMTDGARDITFSAFCREIGVQNLRRLETTLGYTRLKLTLTGDYHVAYFRGRYKKRPCVFLLHSATEYVFC